MQSSNINYSKFINYISTQKKLPKVHAMSDMLNISTRNIYYLLQSANSELGSAHQPALVPNTKITEKQILILTTKLSLTPNDQYINSYERQLIMDTCIALSLKKWTISEFQILFHVSRNTVLRNISDLKKREIFKPKFSKKNGFEFEESSYDVLIHVYNNLIELQYSNNSLNQFIQIFDNTICHSQIMLVSEQLQNIYKETINKEISTSTANTLTIFYILASLYAEHHDISDSSKFFSISDVESLKKRIEYDVIKNFTLIMQEEFTIKISKPMELVLTLQLLSISKEKDDHFNATTFQDLLVLSNHLVHLFIDTFQIESTNSEEKKLTRDVQTQLKPFWYSVHFQSITVYEYLYHELSFEKKFKNLLVTLIDDPLYKKLFPSGLLPNQITILAMIFYNYSLSHEKVSKLKILMITSLPIYSQNLFKTIITKRNSIPCKLTIRAWDITEKFLFDINSFDLIITELADINTQRPTFLIDRTLKDSEFERLNSVIYQIYTENSIHNLNKDKK